MTNLGGGGNGRSREEKENVYFQHEGKVHLKEVERSWMRRAGVEQLLRIKNKNWFRTRWGGSRCWKRRG